MKELTIEEKAKAYDEAIERAKLSRALILDIGKEATEIEYIFPELKEPKEDIRLYMINMIKSIRYNNTVYGWFQDGKDEEMLNWLEKQGKEMSMKSCAEYYYNKSSELNMPELSDFQNELATILMEREYDGPSETEDDIERGRLEYELAAIRISERLLPLVTREEKPTEKQDEQKSVDKIEPKFKVGDIIKYVGEREEFSKENHTIKKILDDCYLTIDDMHIPFKFEEYYIPIEQNPAWSEEDEKIINALRTVCLLCSHNEMDGRPWNKWADWLKSLKDKIYPKSKQEWSEEDD